jgi:hypothetical protein
MAYKRILFVVMLSAALAALDEEGRDSEYMAEHDVDDPSNQEYNQGVDNLGFVGDNRRQRLRRAFPRP